MSAITIKPASPLPIALHPTGPSSIPVEIVAGIPGPPGPPGPGGGGEGTASYQHSQTAPATVWTIAHNLGFRPSVTVLSITGAEIQADVRHLSADVVTVTFLLPTAGSAHLV